MPYIKQEDRHQIDDHKRAPLTAGELNYVFTVIIHRYWRAHKNYQSINDIVGALEGAKAEFQRRIVAPYEDMKINDNGDIA